MGRYTVSMTPRLGAAAMLSAFINSSPSPSASNTPPAETHCREDLRRWAQERASDPHTDSHTNKRPKVTVVEVQDMEAPAPDTSSKQSNTNGKSRMRERPLRRYKGLFVEEFPDPLAGAPVSNDCVPEPDLEAYMRSCGTMANPTNFEIAELLMTSRLTDANKDRHLKSSMYRDRSPWPDCNAMLSDIDKLAHGPEFELHDIDLFDGRRPRPQFLVCRGIIEIIRDFFANPAFKNHMRYKPWRLYTSASKFERVYADMAASDWWWKEMEKLTARGIQNATIAPLIIATDQTTLSVICGGQKAYPVYVSFGNLDKDWRRKPSKHGMYLLGYLPVDSFEDISDDDERKRLKADLVHRSMEKMLEPLRMASEQGVEMWCPDGRLRRIYPRVAAYTADWPEQNLQCCTTEGGCPICKTTYANRGKLDDTAELREREETLSALRAYILTKNEAHLDLLKLKPVWPWWGDLPDVNLAACITPDLLHQAYQGLFKSYLVPWLKEFLGVDVLDERFAAMPPAEGIRHFSSGISVIPSNRWTGRESKQLLEQFLPAVVGEPLSPEMTQMVRALIDFMYRAHATSLTESDLQAMDDDLAIFHSLKEQLIGPIYENDGRFNKIAKLHMLRHWTHVIRELGTPDGYNTEAPEHLHIEYAKVPWRASNKVRPLPQMVKYIQRQEAIRVHRACLDRYLAGDIWEDTEERDEGQEPTEQDVEPIRGQDGAAESYVGNATSDVEGGDDEPFAYPNPSRQLAVRPTVTNKPIREVQDRYQASNLIYSIKDFLTRRCNVPRRDVSVSPENTINLWHKLYLYHPPPSFAPFDPIRRDVVRARPPTRSEPGVWDVGLYLERPNRLRPMADIEEKHGIERYRAGRVRAIFTLPSHLRFYYPELLAYVEVFTPFDASVSPFNKLHSTKPDYDSKGRRRTLIVPVSEIVFACHLVPKFHKLDEGLALHKDTDLLSISRYFWLNHYYNHHFFRLVQHWRRRRRPRRLQERLSDVLQRTQPQDSE